MSDGFLQKEALAKEVLPVQTPEDIETDAGASSSETSAPIESASFEQPAVIPEDASVSVMPASPTTDDTSPVATEAPTAGQAYVKDEVTIEVEKILEEGLGEFVQTMPNEVKLRFLRKGQEVAMILAGMVREYKVKVKQAIHLIRDWLLTIPGVNKFFLEQEAKIKTDRILDLEKVRHDGLPATP